MTKRLPADPAPGPLEDYAAHFDGLLATLAQRRAFRRYLQGLLLLSAERNKTLTALANTEPVVLGHNARKHRDCNGFFPKFLSESSWNPEELNRHRMDLMLEDPKRAPKGSGVLVIDETGDRKDGKATAHVGNKQYLGGIGKIDNGVVVSVSSLYAEERIYYPVEVEPYTPAHHFLRAQRAILPFALRACADRLATFHICRSSERSNRLFIAH
jgi:SRSO17 transposase